MAPPTTATGAFFRRLRYGFDWPAIIYGACWGLLTFCLIWLFILTAHAHDWKRPDLDQWYSSLQNPNSPSSVIKSLGCCSKDDCHETEADLRGPDWWARLGTRRVASTGEPDWELGEWVKVPVEAVLLNQPNPTGNAVICHSMSIDLDGHVTMDRNTVFCFIPPTES